MSPNPMVFGRECRVTVGAFGVENLRVGFTIERSLNAREPNTCEIAVYNLSRQTRESLDRSEGAIPVAVYAGYVAPVGMSLLFRGELREVFSRPEHDGSWVTIVRSGDGDQALRNARATRGFRPGVSIDRVVSSLAEDLKVGVGNLGKAVREAISKKDYDTNALGEAFAKGLAVGGSAAAELDKILGSVGLEWSVQSGEVQAMPFANAAQQRITVLSPTSGLEGVPEVEGESRLAQRTGKFKADKKKVRPKVKVASRGRVSFRARLVPGLSPGYIVELQSEEAKGIYRIEKVRYVGDTHGQDWSAEVEAGPFISRSTP